MPPNLGWRSLWEILDPPLISSYCIVVHAGDDDAHDAARRVPDASEEGTSSATAARRNLRPVLLRRTLYLHPGQRLTPSQMSQK